MRRITESEIKQTGKMKELVVRAGKYFSVGILFIACLPVFLPFLFFLSVFGFTFVLPLGCALAGFLYFRKYVGMLYRKLPIPKLSAGCSARGRRRQRLPPASTTEFIELPTSDLLAIEIFEAVDPEFDAVVVSTAQQDAPDDPAIWSWLGEDSVHKTSPDDGIEREEINDVEFAEEDSKREGKDADISVQDGTTITGHDDGTLFENGTRTEAREIDSAPEDGTREERIAEGTSAEDENRREGLDEDIVVEHGNEREGVDEDISGEVESRTEGMDEDVPIRDESRKEGIYEDTSPEDGNKTEGIVELTPVKDENRRKGIVEDISAEGETRVEVIDSEPSIESGTRREGIDDGGRLDGENGKTVVGEEGVLQDVGRFREFSQEDETGEKQGDEVEHSNEEKADKNVERDDDFHTLPSASNHQRSVETLEDIKRTSGFTELDDNGKEDEAEAHPDFTSHPEVVIEEEEMNDNGVDNQALVDTDQKSEASLPDANLMLQELDGEVVIEEEERNDNGVDSQALVEETTDQKIEASLPDANLMHQELDGEVVIEEEERNDNGVDSQALVEETTDQKIEASLPDAKLMHEEVDGDDQEKRTDSSTTPGAISPEDSYHIADGDAPMKAVGVRNLLPHQAHEDDIWTCKDCGWKYPNARPSAKIRRNHKKHCVGHPPPRADPSPEQLGKGEIERSFILDSNGEGGNASRVAEADVPNSLDLQHHPKQVAFGDDAAISSAHSGGNDEESSGVRDSESFRSATNEFPSITSESFRSAPDDLPDERWSGFPSGESQYNEEQDQLAQVEEELQLSDALNAVKGIVGDKHVSTGSLLTDIEELSGFLGIDLPARSAEVPEMEWAKLAIEVLTVVVGID